MKTLPIVRWILALVCLGYCIKWTALALEIGGYAVGGFLILAFSGLLAFVLLITPETVLPACQFFSRIFTSIILPDDKFHRPPLSYRMAHRYRTQLRYADALDEYRKIIHYYPDELTAYQEVIALAQEQGDVRVARKYARMLNGRIRKSNSRPTLKILLA